MPFTSDTLHRLVLRAAGVNRIGDRRSPINRPIVLALDPAS
jgi:hypothetical protein